MSKTYCTSCGDQLCDDEIRWAFEERYCEDCFNDRFTYCDRCDVVLYRDEAHYNDSVPYCDSCWDDNFDDDCPDNPEVSDADRELIVAVSRNWLLGKERPRYTVKISTGDHLLPRIRDRVGLVEQEIYIYGLRDRAEYQLVTTSDLIDRVNDYISANQFDWRVIQETGCKRLGIAFSLRDNYTAEVVSLIKTITTQKERKETLCAE